MTEDAIPHNPPAGFHALPIPIGFLHVNGPLYVRVEDDRLKLGLRVEMRHCNPMKICHGGMLATFIDMLMPFTISYHGHADGRFMPTVQLTQDYMAPAPLGCWLEGEAQVLRATRSLIFAQCLVTADGELCLRANGVFKLGPEVPGGGGLSKFLQSLKNQG